MIQLNDEVINPTPMCAMCAATCLGTGKYTATHQHQSYNSADGALYHERQMGSTEVQR